MQATMERPRVLWIDLRLSEKESADYDFPNEPWDLHRCTDMQRIEDQISQLSPKLICFDFNHPDMSGLIALKQTALRHSELPVLMITEHHSEDLAVWAFRSGVRDYLVKPVTVKDIIACAKRLSGQNCFGSCNPIPAELKFRAPQKNRVGLAKAFIENHYEEKITVGQVAEYCDMSIAAFTRWFKTEYGMPFRTYLMQFRMEKAKQMLLNPHASVTDVVYATGFSDPSYFTRMFRRFTGSCPTCYRDDHLYGASQQN